MDCLSFLERVAQAEPQPIYALHGDEDFLKRQARDAIRAVVLGPDGASDVTSVPGDKAVWANVHDELCTLSFLGGRRLVVVEAADAFVTKYRPQLEKYVAAPSPHGVLVLEVKSLPGNTRLAKALPAGGNVECKAPPAARLPEWCVRRCATLHGKQLVAAAAQLLVQLVGPEMGLLDMELAKLSAYAGEAKRIDAAAVDRLVGSSRTEDVWKIFDALSAGNAAEALALLDRLFVQGSDPHMLLGAFSYQMRQLARANRLNVQGRPLAAALEEAGFHRWKMDKAEAQMRHLGRRRLEKLYDGLLEVDFGLKGGSALPPRLLLERLVVALARKLQV